MSKIIMVSAVGVVNDGMFAALVDMGHFVDRVADTDPTFTKDLLLGYDIILAYAMGNNVAVVSEAIDMGIPAIVGLWSSPLAGKTSATTTLGMLGEEYQANARRGLGIANRRDMVGVVSDDDYDIFVNTGFVSNYVPGSGLPNGCMPFNNRGTGVNWVKEFTGILYPKGTVGLTGHKFNADCIYWGGGFKEPPTPAHIAIMTSMFHWLTESKHVNIKLIDGFNLPIPGNIRMYNQSTGALINEVKTDMAGNATLRFTKGMEYTLRIYERDTNKFTTVTLDQLIY